MPRITTTYPTTDWAAPYASDHFAMSAAILANPALSVMARGVFAIASAHYHIGDTEGASIEPLLFKSGDNEDAVLAALNELVGAGLVGIEGGKITFYL